MIEAVANPHSLKAETVTLQNAEGAAEVLLPHTGELCPFNTLYRSRK
jgi:hypothetical protein